MVTLKVILTITMDKVEEIVKCEHCYRYMPVSVLEQHVKDDCFIKLVKENKYLPKPHGWQGIHNKCNPCYLKVVPIKNR